MDAFFEKIENKIGNKARRIHLEASYRFPRLVKVPLPQVIYIGVNNACNLFCKMCDVGIRNLDSQFYQIMCPDDKKLDLTALKRLTDEVAFFRPHLAITSTEPLMFPDLFEAARYITSAGLFLQITTNGLLLPMKAEEMVESGVNDLWISLDGAATVHNEIRGNKRSFEKAYEGLQLVSEFSRKKGKGPALNINFTICEFNHDKIIEFLESIQNLPLTRVNISHMNYVNEEMEHSHNQAHGNYVKATQSSVREANPLGVNTDVLWEQICEIKKRTFPFEISYSPDLSKPMVEAHYKDPKVVVGRSSCRAPWTTAQLMANGDWYIITRCFNIAMGNFFEETFLETWHGEKYSKFREWIRETQLSPACTRCCAVLY